MSLHVTWKKLQIVIKLRGAAKGTGGVANCSDKPGRLDARLNVSPVSMPSQTLVRCAVARQFRRLGSHGNVEYLCLVGLHGMTGFDRADKGRFGWNDTYCTLCTLPLVTWAVML